MLPRNYVPTDGDATGHMFSGATKAPALSQEMVEKLREFRKRFGTRLQDQRYTDLFLLRFLRARKFDLDLAYAMLDEHLQFRQENKLNEPGSAAKFDRGIPELIFSELPKIKSKYPHGYHGLDRLGRPIYIEQLGKLDVPSLLLDVTPERLLQYFTHEYERLATYRMPAASIASGKVQESAVTILDLSGMSFSLVWNSQARSTVKALAKIQQDQFPESLGCMVVVNAPRIFSVVWNFVTPLLDPKTVSKIQIFGPDPASFRERLLELIEPHNLPAYLGGTCKCAGADGELGCGDVCLYSDKGPWSQSDIEKTLTETPYWEVMDCICEGRPLEQLENGSSSDQAKARSSQGASAPSRSSTTSTSGTTQHPSVQRRSITDPGPQPENDFDKTEGEVESKKAPAKRGSVQEEPALSRVDSNTAPDTSPCRGSTASVVTQGSSPPVPASPWTKKMSDPALPKLTTKLLDTDNAGDDRKEETVVESTHVGTLGFPRCLCWCSANRNRPEAPSR